MGSSFIENIKINTKEIARGGCWLVSSGTVYEPRACDCEHSNEPPDSVKDWEFLDQVSVLLTPCSETVNIHTKLVGFP